MKRIIVLAALLTTLIACAASAADQPAVTGGDTPQAIYLQAGKLERQDQPAKAKELYETLIDRFPASEFAVKANDRLLDMLKGTLPAPPAKPVPPQAAEPKARARELLSMHKKALDIADKEWQRLSHKFFNLYGHRVNRGELRDQEAEWDKVAEEKVRKELGMGTADIRSKLEEACRELGITGTCDESALK
jgi:hypothetical protein